MPVTGDRYRWEFRLAPGETVADADRAGPAGGAAGAGRPGAAGGRARRRVHVPRAGRRPVAGRAGAAGRRRRPSDARRSSGRGSGWACATCTSWPGSWPPSWPGEPETAAGHLPGRAGAARAGADPGRAAARPADDRRRARRRRRPPGRAGRGRRIPAVARLATDSRTPPLPPGPLVDRRGRPGAGWPGRSSPSRRWSSTGGAAGWTTSSGPGAAEMRPGLVLTVRRADGDDVGIEDPRGALRGGSAAGGRRRSGPTGSSGGAHPDA